MLASIDPVNHSAALVSVPRDLWVTLPGKGSMKINAAYALAKYSYMNKNRVNGTDSHAIAAGLTSIDQTIEKVLGVPVHYNVMLNFQAFRQAVDTVGGVTVNVPEDLYDPTMAWENERNPYLARKGMQQFDGKHALNYVRSRETSSDFARSQRQRAVLLALKEKAVSLGVVANPVKLSGLLGAFGNNVSTDFSLNDASRLYTIFKQISNNKIESLSLAGATSITSGAAGADSLITTGNINGQSIVMPKAGLENYAAIQEYIRGHLKDGYIVKEKARVAVLNGTGEEGLAASTATKLKTYGYNVISTGQAPESFYPSTVVVDLTHGKKKYTKHYLEQRFSVTAVKTLPDKTITPGTADFVVILGGDETGNN
jgi:LCP family protein required for cell wall assembly